MMHVLIPVALLPLLAVFLSRLSAWHASVLALAVIVVFGGLAGSVFSRLTARMRWIWLSMTLLYTCLTPGEYVFPALGWCPLTFEGLLGGAYQLLHVLAMLALVGFILNAYSTMHLLSGIYQWLAAWRLPVTVLQASVARIYLVLQMPTIHTPTHNRALKNGLWLDYFRSPEQLLAETELTFVTLQIQALKRYERCLLALILGFILFLVLYSPA